jgi:hypothetical protein
MGASIRHLNKGAGLAARYRAGGSQGWQAKPRFALSLGRDPNDSDVRVLTRVKGLGKEPKAITFRVSEVRMPGEAEGIPIIVWGGDSHLSADEVHGAEGAGQKRTKTEVLATYIRDRLTMAGEEGVAVEHLIEEAVQHKMMKASDKGTFYRARNRIGVEEVPHSKPLRIRLRPAGGNGE